jgi:SAM-dependent methyltransferase
MSSIADRAKMAVRDTLDQTLTRLGFAEPPERLTAAAQSYWTGRDGETWSADSHWRNGLSPDDWQAIGADHWRLWESFSRSAGVTTSPHRIVEWGCGGGANAVAFAPHAAEYVAADIVPESVAECRRQVAEVCDTAFTGVVVDAAAPEVSARDIEPCDLFLCLYVLELVPTPEYGLGILRIAADLLAPGGLAMVQIKYRTNWRTAPRRRRYKGSTAASMTSYRIDEFWKAATDCGLRPQLVHLVPKNSVDERYAYFLLAGPT